MRGMILAAGEGRRMQPLTHAFAKPALPVLGVPLVVDAARLLRAAGIREIVVNLYHRGRSIREALEGAQRDPRPTSLSDLSFTYSREETLLGTGGGIGHVKDWLAEEGTAVVVNGDFLSDIDLPAMIAAHRKAGALATLAVVEPSGPFPGELWVDGRDRIVSFGSAPEGTGKGVRGPLEFTGAQVIEPELLARFPDRKCDSVRDVYRPILGEGRLGVHRHAGWWWEFGSLERFLDGQLRLVREKRHIDAGVMQEWQGGGVAWLAPGADLAAGATVRGVAVIGSGARVRPGAEIEDSVILDNALIPSACRVARCVVAPSAVLTGGTRYENLAVSSAVCSSPPPTVAAPETPGARPALPDGCRALQDLWVRELGAAEPAPSAAAGRSRAGRRKARS